MEERERDNMSENEYKYTDITFVHKPDCCDERYREYLLHDAIHIDKFSCRSCKYLLPKWCRKKKFLWMMDGIEFNDDAKMFENKLENK